MNLYEEIADTFRRNEWTWNTRGGIVVPNAEDVEEVLDRAATVLYAEEPGATLEVGRLIIQKTNDGYDVFVLTGSYS